MHDVARLPTAKFALHSDDPSLEVSWRGGGRFGLAGEVKRAPSASLEVSMPGEGIEVTLPTGSRAPHAVRAIQRVLPRDVRLESVERNGDIELTLLEAFVPAAKPPRLRAMMTARGLRAEQRHENCLEFIGVSHEQSAMTLLCDGHRVTLPLPGRTTAGAAAALVAVSLPKGYRAVVDGAAVTVWKDADFFSMVA
jgi:hypothetical protein